MYLLRSLLLSLAAFSSYTLAQEASGTPVQKHEYQSDVTRLRRMVINSLYSNRDVFLRELVSNANDALEKLRITSLIDKDAWNGADPLNITIQAVPDESGIGGRIIVTDTGIGMTAEELTVNLGTLAKSGTSEFLSNAESSDSSASGNLIGAFGVGFYSSFLVADRVYVASRAAKREDNPNPVQYVFSSSADEASFEVYPDPRGNTLDHGTEITLVLKKDASEYLDVVTLIKLINTHSVFSSSFPIYIYREVEEEVPDEDEPLLDLDELAESDDADDNEASFDDDEAVVEEEIEEIDTSKPKMKTITVNKWEHLNSQLPLWMRDPKNVTDDEYGLLYQATFKDHQKPLAWHHFSGDSSDGVSFHAIIFVPNRLDREFWQQAHAAPTKDVRLMVKHVFITSDLGEETLPKWASWVKVIIDADDLALNVSRETLQTTEFLKQIKQLLLRRLVQLFSRMVEDDPEKFVEASKVYNSVFKLGATEDKRNQEKLVQLTRFDTNQRNFTSLDDYVSNKKEGQHQIFFLSDMGKTPEDLAKSVFIEKLHARGYEVLLLNEPLDEIMLQNLRFWKGLPFQDVAKAGLRYGDEARDEEAEKAEQEEQKELFAPLIEWLKVEADDIVRDVVISNRLVTSPCAVVADEYGFTGNIQRMLSAMNGKQGTTYMSDYAKKLKVLEINPRSPLIEGLLRRVEQLPTDEEEGSDERQELREVVSILIDTALVRSGFEVPNSNGFLTRIDRVLRRSLGVSETATADDTVKPAPPIDPAVHQPAFIDLPDEMKDKISIEMEEIDEFGNPVLHDEL